MIKKKLLIVGLGPIALALAILSPRFLNQKFAGSPLTQAQAESEAESKLPPLKDGEPLPHDLFIRLAKIINPAVVNISSTYLPKIQTIDPRFRNDPMFELFQQFAGPMGPRQTAPAQSLGTGFIIREDGLILTNNHVIDKADEIKIQIEEGKPEIFDAKVIGKDAKLDIALIKISAKRKLPVARLGTSKGVQVGQWVSAFGNPFGHGHSMSKGIVSALGREIDEINLAPFIQTDASINPGNSGGPLVDTSGLVIGVNTAIDQRAQGIGFAIPIDSVKAILADLEKNGSVKRGFLGIQMGELNEETAQYLNLESGAKGVVVLQVVPGSPAAKAGFREYDLLTELDGQKIDSWRDVQKIVAREAIGKTVSAKVSRNNKTVSLKVTIGDQPSESVAQEPRKKYEGQKAPFNFGFRVADYTAALGEEFGLPPLRQPGPIVIDVENNSIAARAGLSPGDVILDVNLKRVVLARDFIKLLKKDERNVLRVLNRNRVVLLELKSKK